jgi:uncharacterized protein YqeY
MMSLQNALCKPWLTVSPTYGMLIPGEKTEIELLQAYMPEQLSSAEVEALVATAIAETAASTIKDMGKVMALVKTRAAGRADMAAVSAIIKAKLGAG